MSEYYKQIQETLEQEYKEIEKIKNDKEINKLIRKNNSIDKFFLDLKWKCDEESNNFIDFLVKFYLTDEISILKLEKKIKEDKRILNNLLYNIYSSEYVMEKILERIEEQNEVISPRVYDSFSQLQKSIVELVKMYEIIKDNMEKKYKEIGESGNKSVVIDNVFSSDDVLDVIKK